DSSLEDAYYYLKVMDKIIEKGENFVETEITRLETMSESGKISESNIDSFSVRINVLKRFKE
ncbi:hypothetical protein, partial [Salmonella sp. s54836]|uniref:hypothetical protein n=1 Tax=Salmonella sp. s54836 TaxID=3159673 RepID=UPI00397FE314